MSQAFAIELDAIGDTRPLWLAWLDAASAVLEVDPAALPADRAEAAAELDGSATGNWQVLLERYSETHAPAFLRRDAATSAVLRSLAARGVRLGVFTDAPEPLARVALAQLGGTNRVALLEAGPEALERVLVALGAGARVVRTRSDLLASV